MVTTQLAVAISLAIILVMERDAFSLMAASERDHWWFRGRRYFIERTIRAMTFGKRTKVLDAGCGSGGNLELMSQFGELYAFEYDEEACAASQSIGIGRIARGSLPDGVPFEGVRFNLIGLFDVLEHLERPVESLSALAERLADDGALVITVPALPLLWGPHDVVHRHYRRYTRKLLTEHLAAAGLEVKYISYMNMLLLPLAIVQRLRERVFGYRPSDLQPSPMINAALLRIWCWERIWIPQRHLPIGLSLIAVARLSSTSNKRA